MWAVLFHHYNNHLHSGSQSVFPSIGQEAVIIFFVLSGFLISWVVDEKEKTIATFFARRLSRFYSVMIPSLLMAIVLYGVVLKINPEVYPDYINIGTKNVLPKALLTLTFLNYNNFIFDAKVATTDVYWSLTYEFWYYVVFGIFIFVRQKKIAIPLILGIFILFLGIKPLLLWPTWLLGVWTYYFSKRINWTVTPAYYLFAFSLVGLFFLKESNLRHDLSLTEFFATGDLHHSEDCIYLFLISCCVSLNFLAFIAWSKRNVHRIKINTTLEKIIRYPASVSFVLYLTHMPIMFLLKALLGDSVFTYFLAFLTLGIVLLIGRPIEKSKSWYYGKFSAFFNRMQRT